MSNLTRIQHLSEDPTDRHFERLSPSERALERRAHEEERRKRAWLGDSPSALARRIPNSVFALGQVISQRY